MSASQEAIEGWRKIDFMTLLLFLVTRTQLIPSFSKTKNFDSNRKLLTPNIEKKPKEDTEETKQDLRREGKKRI